MLVGPHLQQLSPAEPLPHLGLPAPSHTQKKLVRPSDHAPTHRMPTAHLLAHVCRHYPASLFTPLIGILPDASYPRCRLLMPDLQGHQLLQPRPWL